MGWFTHNNGRNEEENGELENMSTKLEQNLAELECEEEIMQDKEDFGRVRTNMMKVLRSKHDEDMANRALSRINKRIGSGYLNQESII